MKFCNLRLLTTACLAVGYGLLSGCGGSNDPVGSGGGSNSTNSGSLSVSIINPTPFVALTSDAVAIINGKAFSQSKPLSTISWSVTKLTAGAPDITVSNANCEVASKISSTINTITQSVWACGIAVSGANVLKDSTYRLTLSSSDTGGNTSTSFQDVLVSPVAGTGGGSSQVTVSIVNSESRLTAATGTITTIQGRASSILNPLSTARWVATKLTANAPDLILGNADCSVATKRSSISSSVTQSFWGCDLSVETPSVNKTSNYRVTFSSEDSKGNASASYQDVTVAPSTDPVIGPSVIVNVVGSKTTATFASTSPVLVSGSATVAQGTIQNTTWVAVALSAGAPVMNISNKDCIVATRTKSVSGGVTSGAISCDAVLNTSSPVTADTTYRVSLTSVDSNTNASTDYRDITFLAGPATLNPVASTPASLTVHSGDNVQITCSATGGTVFALDSYRFAWSPVANPSGLSVSTSNNSPAELTFKAPAVTTSSTLTYQCRVTDSAQKTATSNTVVTILPSVPGAATNLTFARAGGSQSTSSGLVVTLDGSTSSTTSLGGIFYTWTQISGPVVVLGGVNSPKASFTAPAVTQPTALTFRLIAQSIANNTANATASETDVATVYVNPNPDLVLTLANAQTVPRNTATNITVAVSPVVAPLYYSWTQVSGASVILGGANTSSPSFISPNTTGLLVFSVSVSRKPLAQAAASEIFTGDLVVNVNP